MKKIKQKRRVLKREEFEVTAYKTSDGCIFSNEHNAIEHENMKKAQEKVYTSFKNIYIGDYRYFKISNSDDWEVFTTAFPEHKIKPDGFPLFVSEQTITDFEFETEYKRYNFITQYDLEYFLHILKGD